MTWGGEDEFTNFYFPKNDKDQTIFRDGFLENFEEDELKDFWFMPPGDLEKTPKTVKVKTDTSGLDFNTRWGKKIVTHGDHIYRYDFRYDVINGGKLTMTEIIPVVFNPNGGEFNDSRIEGKDKAKDYTVWVEYGGSVFDDVPEEVVKGDNTFLGWTKYPEYNPYVEPKSSFENIKTKTTFYALFEKDVKEQDQEQIPGRENYPYTMAHFDLTDKAKIRPEVEGEKVKRHFQVWSKNKVTLPVQEPVGITGVDDNGRSFTWKFKYWEEVDGNRKWYIDENTPFVVDEFLKKDTYIKAVFEKDYTSNNEQVETFVTHESSKDGEGNFINNFLPTFDQLKAQIKVKVDDKFVEIGSITDPKKQVKVEYLPADGYTDFDTEIYDKLQEKENPKENGVEAPTRIENIKAKLTYPDGEVKEVYIPIKVYKNIYEAKTETQRPVYVPEGYVKVTLDPTDKATDSQKTYYYVNPDAKVVIPGKDPEGRGDNKFVKWTIKGTEDEYKLPERHQFSEETTIEAQYVSDVIPQEGTGKPDYVPNNFVEVKFVPTDKATDATEKIFWVNPEKEVKIPVANPEGKQYFTFKEWKIGDVATGETYKVGTAKKFETATTITATYTESENIISYDPKEPITRPDGYVRVTFEADPGLKLTEQKAYYVKKNAGIKLGDADLVKPGVNAETGYKFDKWDQKDDLEIVTTDITVTAKATSLDDIVPKENPQGGENDKPTGYITVTFKTTDKAGNIEKVVYINPNKAVTLEGQAPEVNPITGYEFADWDRPIKEKIQYKDNDVITAKFNEIGNVVPGDKDKPSGYVKVIFDKGKNGELSGTTSYWVKPEVEVTVEAPSVKANAGYKFTNWDKETTLTANKTDTEIKITAEYEKLEDIVPGDQTKPEAYVTVTFEKGEHGKLEGKTVYYVNPEANPIKTLADITKPTVKAETGYKFKNWNFADTKEIRSDITVIAQYDPIDDIVPGDQDKPEDYITVTFVKGDHGNLEGQTVYYVNPNKAVVLEGKAPTVKANTGYKFASWDTQIGKKIQYNDGDTITALYNKLGDVIPQEKTDGSDKPEGYVTVTFDKGEHGELSGKTVYYVNPNKEVTVPAPKVNPSVGYEFEKWDKNLTQKFTDENTTIAAQYKELGDIIPQEKTDGSDKPNGYVTVKFEAENGSLSGQTVYYVNPNKEVDLTNTAKAINKNPDTGYTAEGGTWDKELKAKFNDGDVLTFIFAKLKDVIPKEENGKQNPKPQGYVSVAVVPTYMAEDSTVKYYWVNPGKEVTIPEENPKARDGYVFNGWDQSLTQQFKTDTTIIAKYTFKERPGSSSPVADYVFTKVGVQPGPEDYQKVITPPADKIISSVDIVELPDVGRPGLTSATVKINYDDGTSEEIIVKVYVEREDNGESRPYPDPYPYPIPTPTPSRPLNNGFITITEYKERELLRREVRYMQGFEGKFRPKDSLTRAEAAQILANALKEDGYKFDPAYKLFYKDIQGQEWYAEAIRITTQADVFKGYDDGNFRPDQKITRAEWIATLRRFQYIDNAEGNSMKLRSDHWAISEVEAAYKEGWLKIYQDGLADFAYDKAITRQEVAAVSNKAFNRVLDKKFILDKNQDLINYSDVSPDMWAYEDILCASNTFLHKRQGKYLAYESGPKTYSIDIKDSIIEQDLFQRIAR